ncbi:MAG: hypothetical protein PVJ57_19380 [Phycisphaerae bacterium]|jgi:hypothetical protein
MNVESPFAGLRQDLGRGVQGTDTPRPRLGGLLRAALSGWLSLAAVGGFSRCSSAYLACSAVRCDSLKLHDRRMRGIASADQKATEALDKETAAKVSEAEAALAQAKADLAAALKAAAEAREEAGPGAPGRKGPTGIRVLTLDEIMERVGDRIAMQTSVVGTFNAAALQGLGGNSPADRTARATEQIVKNTAETERGVRRLEQRLTFS